MDRLFNNIWFKCITVLLLIAAVSGGILAIFNDVFYVSAEERTQRAIKKIYGEEKEYSVLLDSEAGDTPFLDEKNYGRIDKIYTIDQPDTGEYDMLFNSTGFGGYKNGTITVWVQVRFPADGNITDGEIIKVILESYEKQTLMSKFGESFFSGFYLEDVTERYFAGEHFTSDKNDTSNMTNPVSGATYSANAGCNAVNCVLEYLKTAVGGEE